MAPPIGKRDKGIGIDRSYDDFKMVFPRRGTVSSRDDSTRRPLATGSIRLVISTPHSVGRPG